MLIHKLHHLEVFWLFWYGGIIQGATRNTQQFTLASQRQPAAFTSYGFHSCSGIPNVLALFFKKSSSTFSCPIWAYSFSTGTVDSSKPASLEAEKAAEALARNSDFHFEIVTGLTSNFSDK
jgi:hypothetical protein